MAKAWLRSEELVRPVSRRWKALVAGPNMYNLTEHHARAALLHRHGLRGLRRKRQPATRHSGGGRYDNLLRDVGGEPLSGVGFAMGDVGDRPGPAGAGTRPALATTPAAVLVTVFSPELAARVTEIGRPQLRRAARLKVTWLPRGCQKLPKQFKFADRMGMQAVLVAWPG